MKKGYMDKKKVLLLIAVHLFICLWIGSAWDGKKIQVSYDGNQLEKQAGHYSPEFMGGGLYINETAGVVEDFASTPKINLKRGTYLVTIEYAAEAEGQIYGVSADRSGYRIKTGLDQRKLKPEKNVEIFYVWLDREAKGYHVKFDYSGAGYLLIKNISIAQTNSYLWMRLAMGGTILILLDVFCALKRKKIFQKLTLQDKNVGIGLFVICFAASIPLMSYYLLAGHDLSFHLLRIEGIKDGLLSGQFPVRIQPGWFNGYGYAASIFYGDLFLYIPAVLRAVGFPLQTAYKVFILLVNAATCIGAYYCFYRVCNIKYAALIGSMLYTLAPYRLGNIYIRAAVGEFTAMTFFPFIAVGLYLVLKRQAEKKERKHGRGFIVIGFTGIIQSHVISCEMAAFFTILVCLIFVKRIWRDGRWKELLSGAGVTLLLNLWFLIPFMDYSLSGRFQVVQTGETAQIQTYAAFPSQLFDMFPNGTGSAYTVYERLQSNQVEMPLTVGFVLMGTTVLFLFYCMNVKGNEEERRLGKFSILLAGLALWMSTIWFPWDLLADTGAVVSMLIRNLQYGWRMLSAAAILLALAACCLISMAVKLKIWYGRMMVVLYGVMGLLCGGWMISGVMQDGVWEIHRDRSEIDEGYVTALEYVPSGTSREGFLFTQPEPGENVAVSSYGNDRGDILAECRNLSGLEESSVTLPVLYYKGYRAFSDNGQELKIMAGENNRIQVMLPAGFEGNVRVEFAEPILWRVGCLVSILSVGFVLRRKSDEDQGTDHWLA